MRERTLPVNGLDMHVVDAGEGGRPVALLHGFPELAHSWRHQIPVLAYAGLHVVAPDMRGFGGTTAPEEVEAYDQLTLAQDVVALMQAHGHERFSVVGHDWGAAVAWTLALAHPERIERVAGLSVPALPRSPAPPVPILREHLGESFYIVWFQQPGVAEAVLERDVRRTLRTTEVWGPAWEETSDPDPPRPPYWSEEDERLYVEAFTRTGFTGGLNWYRNLDRSWERMAPYAGRTIDRPALFLTGTRDPVRQFMPAAAMEGLVTNLRTVEIQGAGHWVQQERPDEVNAALLDFLTT